MSTDAFRPQPQPKVQKKKSHLTALFKNEGVASLEARRADLSDFRPNSSLRWIQPHDRWIQPHDTDSQVISNHESLGSKKQVGTLQRLLEFFVYHQRCEMFTGFIIVANFVVICMETDARSELAQSSEGSEMHRQTEEMLNMLSYVNLGFLAFYSLEFFVRICVKRTMYFLNTWNCLDFFILLTSILSEILNRALAQETILNTQLLRSMRLMRLLRASRLLISFPELYNLVSGLTTCMKTLMWAGCLIFLMLTAWSILAVEYINPLMLNLEQRGFYESCSYCPGAFRSIMHSNLSFFEIMSGNANPLLTRIIIEEHSWTAVIFVLVIISMVFGLLNLVTAVVVDAAAAAREGDIRRMAARKQKERDLAWKCFAELVLDLGKDSSGDINMDELKTGLKSSQELCAHLSVMGVEEKDFNTLFDILDEDGNGILTHEEFVHQLYKMKTIESSTTTFFMKAYIDEIYNMLRQMDIAQNRASNLEPPSRQGTFEVEDHHVGAAGSGILESSPEIQPKKSITKQEPVQSKYKQHSSDRATSKQTTAVEGGDAKAENSADVQGGLQQAYGRHCYDDGQSDNEVTILEERISKFEDDIPSFLPKASSPLKPSGPTYAKAALPLPPTNRLDDNLVMHSSTVRPDPEDQLHNRNLNRVATEALEYSRINRGALRDDKRIDRVPTEALNYLSDVRRTSTH